jgi:hypothetical protein
LIPAEVRRLKPEQIAVFGYVVGSILAEALRRDGTQLDTEKLVYTLENLKDFDAGIGAPIGFGRNEHQGSHKVWGTQLDGAGHYQPVELE